MSFGNFSFYSRRLSGIQHDRCDAKLTARSRARVPTRPLASQGSSLSLSLRYRACHVDGCKPLRKESKKSRDGRVFQAPGGASRFTSKTMIQCDAHIKHHNAAGRHGKPKGKARTYTVLIVPIHKVRSTKPNSEGENNTPPPPPTAVSAVACCARVSVEGCMWPGRVVDGRVVWCGVV